MGSCIKGWAGTCFVVRSGILLFVLSKPRPVVDGPQDGAAADMYINRRGSMETWAWGAAGSSSRARSKTLGIFAMALHMRDYCCQGPSYPGASEMYAGRN